MSSAGLAVGRKRFGKGDAGLVGDREPRRVEHAGAGGGRIERGRETRAFLVAEGEHVDAERQAGGLGAREVLGRQDAGDDAERAVVLAGVDHRVDMRADQEAARRRGAPPSSAAAQRPRTVPSASSLTARPASRIQAGDQVGGAAMLRRQEQAHEAVGLGGNRRERVDHRLGALAQHFGVNRGHQIPSRRDAL